MQKSLEQEYLERKVSGVKASIPALALLEKSPAGNCVGQVLHVMLFCNVKGRHVDNG